MEAELRLNGIGSVAIHLSDSDDYEPMTIIFYI